MEAAGCATASCSGVSTVRNTTFSKKCLAATKSQNEDEMHGGGRAHDQEHVPSHRAPQRELRPPLARHEFLAARRDARFRLHGVAASSAATAVTMATTTALRRLPR